MTIDAHVEPDLWPQLRALPGGDAGLQQAAEAIRNSAQAYTSVFLYGFEDGVLVLRSFSGRPTDLVRIGVGEGVCGRAVATGENQLIADVTADADYISCSLQTRSECVVLVRRGAGVVGQIDIDSDIADAFSPDDVSRLEAAAALIAPLF